MATSEKIRIENGRLSFARLFKPKAFREGQDPRFEGSILLDPSDKKHAAKIDEICERAHEILAEHYNGKIPKGIKLCFGYADGSPVTVGGKKYNSEEKDYDGYEGMFYLSSANKTKPKTVHRNPRVELAEDDGVLYSGCYVNMTVTLWTQDNEYGKRVNANLRAVQFVKDGEAFGVAPVDAEEEFDEVEIEDDEGGDNWDE
jgi:hypothetical protein